MMTKRPGSVADVQAGWGIVRSRISWGAVLAGAVVAVAMSLLLSLLGAAMGAGWSQPFDIWSDLGRLGTGAVIWSIVNLALSMALGGYVAARLSGTHSQQDAELHGLTTWAIAVLLGSWLFAHLLGSLAGMVGQGVGSFMSRSVGDAGTASRIVAPEVNLPALSERLRQALSSSEDPTAMNREQIGAEITVLVQGSLLRDLSDQDYQRLVALVAAESGITREEAARRVTRLDNEAKANRAQVAEKARIAAETAAHGAGTAARALFTALTAGLLASLVGAWFGTRHERALHPRADERDYAARTPAYGARGTALRERAQPGSRVYDDTRRLISLHLRGASFPVSKQDLARLARSGNARPELLRAIEAMPDGQYASIDEVMEALDMALTS